MKPLRAVDQGGTVDLPVNARVLARLLSALDNAATPTHTLSELVLCDPALTLHLLASVGAYAPGASAAQAQSIDACLSLLGYDMLQALVYRQLGAQLCTDPTLCPPSVLARIWGRSVLCRELAGGLARKLNRAVAPARLAGLFHLLGRLALLRSRAEAYAPMLRMVKRSADLLRAEREAFGTTHDVLGATWLERCGLPGFAPEAVGLMHEPVDRLIDAPFEVRAVKVAVALVEDGWNDETSHAAGKLLGMDASAVVPLLQEAHAAARANPAGIEIEDRTRSAAARDARLVLGGDLSLEPPARIDTPADHGLFETISAIAESGANWSMRQALAAAAHQQDALVRVRRLTRLLTGFGPQLFFLATPDEKRLVGVPVGDNLREVEELAVTLEASPSLLARAARERLAARAVGAALDQAAALDRVLARVMGSRNLLFVPMTHDSAVLGVTVIALPGESPEPCEQEGLLARITVAGAEQLCRAKGKAGGDEQTRAELTERFRSVAKRIVHEAGNPLSIVKNYLKLLGDKLPQSEELTEQLQILNQELDRVARILQRLSDPFAAELEQPSHLDLNAMVHELMILCRDTLFARRGIEVVQQLDPSLPPLESDPGAIKQVTLNILTNAAEAMPDGGRLAVMTADNVNLGGELFALLQISDTGPGVAPEVMQRLFQPGTTTKAEGHQGIGLAVSASILQRLGGRILCRSSPGRGTIFLVLLPRRVHAATPGAVDAGA